MNEALRKAQAKFKKTGTRRFTFELNRNTDADIIAYLEKQENRQGLLKQLVRDHMKRNG